MIFVQGDQERKPNRLIHEKSPYLLQHAYNPVDWYPWGEEAFEAAKKQDKPVFVSIGYSSCHWCHVMEKESFDNDQVAKLMNAAFICIKVDREERPDLDGAYMAACQVMGRSCGWPLNVIMTPDKKPFFASSYIPKDSRFGLAGMVDLIPQIEEMWKARRSDLENLGDDITRRIETLEKRTVGNELGKDVLDDAYEKLVLRFDTENGGFGNAPKFPSPHNLIFLLRYWNRTKEKNALTMAEKTLRAMRTGGIFDQVGFGFHRYSTDAEWLVPHFEKMLYDQALMALAYTEAFQATGAGKFKITAKETLTYVLRDLVSPQGGFYAAEDADSEGEEGKFYMWTEEEIRKALPPEDADLAVRLFGVKAEGNYAEAGRKRNRKNILHLAEPLEKVASESQLTVDKLIFRLGKICSLLFKAREKRVHPSKDDKILVDWNGLMIAALAKASNVFGERRYLEAAVKAAGFILEKMRDENGVLYHRYAKGERAIEGFLNDYAFLVWGLVEIYEANFNESCLQTAVELTNTMMSRFWDGETSGFFSTMKDTENAMPRRKEVYDGALPSGNSVALLNLLRLSLLTGDAKYREFASKIIRVTSEAVKRLPVAHTFMLVGVDFAVGPAFNVILVGELQEDSMQNLLGALKGNYLPNTVFSIRPPGKAGLGYEKNEGKATAYVCRDQTCMPPTNKPEKMLELLYV
ncbi:MAG: thioredoxin domain-containing protein [Deltaproteobacteria bacterium]